MNILIAGGMFPPMRTGTAFYTQNLALALQARGHQVVVVTLGQRLAKAVESGLDVRRLPALRLPMQGFFKHFQLCAWNPLNWLRLSAVARETRAEVVLLVNHYLDIAFPAVYAARQIGAPLLCSVGTQLQSLNPRRDRILNVLDRLICGKLVFPFCDRIVAWDAQIRQYLEDVQGPAVIRKTAIVNYGVNGDPQELLEYRNDHAYRGVVLGVGAVSEQRSFVPLVRAFARVAPDFSGLRLRIVGHVYYDEARRVAQELGVADLTDFLGELPHDRVIQEMQEADLLYSSLTGKYVGLGTATIEAMLLAVPTVVNTPLDLLGTGSMVDGVHLVQSTDTDPQRIANCIRRLLSDRALRQEIGEGGRQFVRLHLNWDVVARDMEALLMEAVSDRGQR